MSAFEADRFNRSRTSPDNSRQVSWQGRPQLATAFKEPLQQFGATACQDSAADFYFVIQLRVIQHLHYGLHRARFGIVRAVDQAPDPGVHQRSSAHRARFNCSKQVAVGQPMIPYGCARLAQGNDLGMGRRIALGDVAIPAAADDASLAHDYGSDGDFAGFECALRGAESFFHPQFIWGGCWLLVAGRRHGIAQA
jgi:hypothetical protein